MLQERVRIVTSEVKAGRLKSARADVEAFVASAFTLPADERRTLVMVALKEINGQPGPKEEKVQKPTAVDGVLRGAELVRVGAALFRSSPDLGGEEAYQHLLARGYRVGVQLSSWTNGGIAREARALAKTDTTLPKLRMLERDVPVAARPRPKPKPERVTTEVRPRPRAVVARRPAKPVDAAPPAEPSTAVAELDFNGIREGDHVLLELAGRRLDAVKKPGGWTVEFAGEIPDDFVAALMGKMLGRAEP